MCEKTPLLKLREVELVAMVGVSGFEPEASWTRTKRDTKLRHTPSTLTLAIIVKYRMIVKSGVNFLHLRMMFRLCPYNVTGGI